MSVLPHTIRYILYRPLQSSPHVQQVAHFVCVLISKCTCTLVNALVDRNTLPGHVASEVSVLLIPEQVAEGQDHWALAEAQGQDLGIGLVLCAMLHLVLLPASTVHACVQDCHQ